MIDWLTGRLDLKHLNEGTARFLMQQADRIMRYCPKTGEQKWETAAWESIRSDSHQISIKVSGSGLYVMGSPARVIGDGCAVFGSGASADMNLVGCLRHMVKFVSTQLGVILPMSAEKWTITRVDVTENLLLGSLDEVRDALRILRDCEGGRYRVSQQAGDTVYWSANSTLRSGKAYAKGPHLSYLSKKRDHTGREYQIHEIDSANRLLRLELKLARHFFQRNEKPWWQLTADDLRAEWQSYFGRMIGSAEMKNDADVFEQLSATTETEGQARAAYALYLLIKSEGHERAKSFTNRRTWYRNLKLLRAAGLGDADISAGRVVPLRRRIIEAQAVHSWAELFAA